MKAIFAEQFQDTPFWWDAAPRPELTKIDLPRKVDVVVIGSGYTGLNAALQTARAGRTTLVLDKDKIGYGCSSRNGGQAGTSYKPKYGKLVKRFGRQNTINMVQEGHRALEYLKSLIANENLRCDWSHCGRFVGVHNNRAFRKLAADYHNTPPEIAVEYHMVPASEQNSEIGSELFRGGCLLPAHGSLDPGKYHLELFERVVASGAIALDQCSVHHIERKNRDLRVHTSLGTVDAHDVVLATNGYTDEHFPWHKHRVLPIGSYQIATEPLPTSTIQSLIPNARVISDTRLIGNYFRLSPDHKRLLFGGRVTFTEANSKAGAETLYQQMLTVFPQLAGTKIAFAWVGYVAYTTDISPHIGSRNNFHYAMGYCGSGITLASYFGMKVGQKVLETHEGQTALDDLEFKPWPKLLQHQQVLSGITQLARAAEIFGA